MIEFEMGELLRLADDLGDAGPQVEDRCKRVVEKTGHDVVSDAQALAPVDTGNLKNSISVDFDADGLGFEAGPTANYAHFLEWGTSRMAPQPYMIPAFDRRIEPAIEALGQVAGRIL